jgi:hypothetical protein
LPERLVCPRVEGFERRPSAVDRIREQVAVGLLDLKDARSGLRAISKVAIPAAMHSLTNVCRRA